MNSFTTLCQDLLVPAGQGVFTVHTAKEHKDKIQKVLYPNSEDVKAQWQQKLSALAQHQGPCVLGVASDNGGGIQRGANWGPLFIRKEIYRHGSREHLFDLGDIKVIPHLLHDKYLNEQTIESCREAIYSDAKRAQDYPVSPLSIVEYYLDQFYQEHPQLPVFALGGDHSVSYPLVKSYLKSKKKAGIKTAIIHFDAHTDLLRKRLGIDLCFGSWCTHILDDLNSPDLLIQLGIRSSNEKKEHWEKTFGVRQYWANEMTSDQLAPIAHEIKEHLRQQGVQELYVSFDIDALDATIAGATGTPEEDGLSTDQCAFILHDLLQDFPLTGADLVEVAPFVQSSSQAGKVNPEPDSTLLAAGSISNILLEYLNHAHRRLSSN